MKKINRLFFYPARLATGRRVEADLPQTSLILKSMGIFLAWIVTSALIGWGLKGLMYSVLGPLTPESTRHFASFLLVPFIPAALYFGVALWHTWEWTGDQEEWNWITLFLNGSVFGLLTAIASGFVFLLALPWFSFSPTPGYLLWLNGTLVFLLFMPVLTILLLIPVFFESEYPSALRSLWTTISKFATPKTVAVMSLTVAVAALLSLISFGVAGILCIPYVMFQFLYIRQSEGNANQSLDAGTESLESSRRAPAVRKKKAPAAKKKSGKKSSKR